MRFEARVRTVKYGRKQTLLTVEGLDREEAEGLLRFLKRRLGVGGYLEDGVIVLQGDVRGRLGRVLREWGGGGGG